jgi:hypothetical protein
LAGKVVQGLRLVVSGANAEAIQRAVERIKTFLDSVGAKYRFHDSGKSDSAYFHVREPARVAADPWNPDVVDTRVSDHTLPSFYDSPDLDVSVPKPRPKAVSPDFAVKLLKDFLKGKIDIEDGEVIPVNASVKEYPVSGLYRKTLYPISSSFIQSKIVYHGTPNKVGDAGEFSTSFIGEGEGYQAFGWGLYFSESKAVADWYYRKLRNYSSGYFFKGYELGFIDSEQAIVLSKDGEIVKVLDGDDFVWNILSKVVFPSKNRKASLEGVINDISFVLKLIKGGKTDKESSEGVLYEDLSGNSIVNYGALHIKEDFSSQWDEVAGALGFCRGILRKWLSSGNYEKVERDFSAPIGDSGGYVYEVNIKVPDEYFLVEDWGWDQQSDYVKGCLSKSSIPVLKSEVREWVSRSKDSDYVGLTFLESLYSALGGSYSAPGDLGNRFSDSGVAKKESLLLLKEGIHGYKYLEEASRKGGLYGAEGEKFNYVIIDENDVETVQHQVKDAETGQLDLFTQEQYVMPLKKVPTYASMTSGSLRRIVSVFRSGEGGKEVSLGHLADLINATQADIHHIHFYAGGEGQSWDRVHDVCSDYYIRLAEDYDDVVELCLQLDVDVSHPNDSAVAVDFQNSNGSLGTTFEYESAMQIIQDRINNLVDVAAEVLGGYQGGDGDSVAVRSYLEGFIEEWSKEAGYKLRGRLGGTRDFGGAYRDRVSDEQSGGKVPGRGLITGDVDDPGPFEDDFGDVYSEEVYSGVSPLFPGQRHGTIASSPDTDTCGG